MQYNPLRRYSLWENAVEEALNYLQLGVNAFALAVAGWIYAAYVRNLRSVAEVKAEQLRVVEKSLEFWKDKAAEFEKQTPAYIEEILAKRIKHREEEIARLDEDREQNVRLLKSRTAELERMKAELEKARGIGREIRYYDLDSNEEVIVPDSDLELEVLGEVFVDAACLLIADPSYVNSEWRHDVEYEDFRVYKHVATGKLYRFGYDFSHYDETIAGLTESVNELIKNGSLIRIEVEREFSFSLPGALYASASKKRYGVLEFGNGNEGAGICVSTVYGDGVYPVYGERYKGKIVRVYIDLQ